MVNMSILGLVFGIIISFISIGMIIYIFYNSKKRTFEENEWYKVKQKMGLVVLIVSGGIGLTIYLLNQFFEAPLNQGEDVSNWITLTVEVGVGVVIASLILIYSQSKSKETEREIKKAMQESEKSIVGTLSTETPTRIDLHTKIDTSKIDYTSEKNYPSSGESENE